MKRQSLRMTLKKLLTLRETIKSTKTSGIPVCTRHSRKSSDVSTPSAQFDSTIIDENINSVKKKRWNRTPMELRCQTIRPSFLI